MRSSPSSDTERVAGLHSLIDDCVRSFDAERVA
jgi:hypothetical protein